MRALRYYGTKDLRLDFDVNEPECLPNQIKIKPAFTGICGTDLHEYNQMTYVPTKEQPHPVTGEWAPVVLGHEFSGTVVEVGSDSRDRDIQVGDKVVVLPTISCLKCPQCVQGLNNCCQSIGFIGLHGWGGGLSDYVSVDGTAVYKLPSGVPLDVGALVEPLSVAWHAVSAAGTVEGQDILVLGAGPIGVGVILCLKAKGAQSIIVAEVAKERRRLAEKFGATHVFDPIADDIVKASRAITGGQGPEVVFDCAGVAASLKTATIAARAKGLIVNIAMFSKEVPFHPNNISMGEKTYKAVMGYLPEDFKGVISALGSGAIRPEAMITKKIIISRVVQDGFNALVEDKDHQVKILVDLSL